jgi:methionine synthase II (cobalamin-independent)
MEQYAIIYSNAIQDSLNGNIPGYQVQMIEANKIKAVLDSKEDLRLEVITVDEMYRRMMFNSIYDDINMNTFNFINATFDNLFYRYPTEAEMDLAYPAIEFNGSGEVFGQIVTNKTEYLQVLSTSNEYKEGMIRWAYMQLLSREPISSEVFNRMDEMNDGYNIDLVQQSILISDEYAGFD